MTKSLAAAIADQTPPPGTYPWQDEADPYRILVSEVLLSRTRRGVVARVLGDLFERFPTPMAMASATTSQLWSVLRQTGFRKRMVHLVNLGKAISGKHGGEVPKDRDELLELPAVGPYVADAVRVLSFDGRELPLDLNTARVLWRLGGQEPVRYSPYDDPWLIEFAEQLLRGRRQRTRRLVFRGLLEVSAQICRPEPKCELCPLLEHCATGKQRLG